MTQPLPVRVYHQEATWFDANGDVLHPRNFPDLDAFNTRVEFVVTWHGHVLSKTKPEWALFHFKDPEHPDDDETAAPALPLNFYLAKDGEPRILLRWLKTDEEAPAVLRTMQDVQLYDEDSELTLRCYCEPLRVLANNDNPATNGFAVMRNYKEHVLPFLQQWLRGRTTTNECGSWSSARCGHYQPVIDVFDALEVYHIDPSLVWKSRIGLLLTRHFRLDVSHDNPTVWNFIHALRSKLSFSFNDILSQCAQILQQQMPN